MRRHASVFLLAGFYIMLLFGLWNSLDSWIVARLSADRIREGGANLDLYGRQFIYLNSIAFVVSLFWVARARTLLPISRYLAPTVLGVGVTFLTALLTLLLTQAIPNPGPLTFSSMGLLLYWADCVVPGALAAQLFRLPRRDQATVPVAIEAAV